MSRWHHSSCPFPAVVIGIRDGIPQCHTCQAVPDLAKLAAEVAGYSALPPIPPGEPLHDLGLFWPGTVQYTIHPRSDANSPKERSTKFDDAPDPFPAHAIYEPLPPNSFRILWLGPSANVDDPIHIDLCVFGFDDRPDYETTSYTWGGEDGNDTFCRPIFIGPHWDVLYQTDNCWSMLKFLRPPRGERALWIDAICINQRDTMEREDQVSQMSLIYQQASRLNVFLGSDMITPLPENRAYPPRRPISSLQSELLQNTTSVSLVDLLNRRFFTRLWVVQELTISKQSFMRVGITEYRIDKATMGQVAKEVWNSSPAPWFQQASKGLLKGLKGSSSLLNAVIGAWKCSCSDPRDLIFGVLSIVKESAIVRGEWAEMESHMQPNYAISTQHAFIGMFAHCLAVDRDPRVLMAASGVSGWDKYPSWIPAWESPGPLISVEVDLNYQLYVEWTSEWQHKVLKRCQVTNSSFFGHPPGDQEPLSLLGDPDAGRHEDREFMVMYILRSQNEPFKTKARQYCEACLGSHLETGRSKGQVLGTSPGSTGLTKDIDSRLEGCSNCGLEDVYMRFMEVGGHENIAKTLAYTPVTVMASTGSVLVNLAHFFRINMRPAVVDQMEGTSVLCYHLSATMLNTSDANAEKFDPDEHQIFFTSKTKGLERLICPEKDHLFYLSTGDRRPLFLLLRQTDTPGVFRLVARCLQVFFLAYRPQLPFTPELDPTLRTVRLRSRARRAVQREEPMLQPSEIELSLDEGLFEPIIWDSDYYQSYRLIWRLFPVLAKLPRVYGPDIIAMARLAWADDDALWGQYLLSMRDHEHKTFHDENDQETLEITMYYDSQDTQPASASALLGLDLPDYIKHIQDLRGQYLRAMESLGVTEHMHVQDRERVILDIAANRGEPWEWDQGLVKVLKRFEQSWNSWVGIGNTNPSDPVRIMSFAGEGSSHFVLKARKAKLLKILRETLQRADILRGRLMWGDKVWCESNPVNEGGARAGTLAWSDLMVNCILHKTPRNKEAFTFDGTSYQVEIV